MRRLAAGLALLGLGLACGDPTAPRDSAARRGEGTMVVSAVMNAVSATTLVLEVSGPGIAPTLVFNLPVVNGVAAGTVAIPAGADRLITARAFDGQTETHRGTRTQTIVAGANAAVTLLLIPLQGSIPITVTLGSLLVTVTPNTATPRVGDTLQFSAAIQDVLGQAASFPVAWASSDTRVAIVEPSGRAIMTGVGTALIVATTNGAAGTASLTVSPATGPAPPAYLKTWVGGAGTGGQRTDWAFANNWLPAGVPTFTDSVVIGAATFQPSIQTGVDTFRVRDLVLQPSANLQLNFRTLTVTGGVLHGAGGTVQSNGTLRLVGNARLRGVVATSILATGGGTVTAADSARLSMLTVDGTSTVFDVAGRKVTLTGASGNALFVQNGGMLQMDQAADTLDAGGIVYFYSTAASHLGALTNGTLLLRGGIGDGNRLSASGNHTTILVGAAAQTISGMDFGARPGNAFQLLRLTGTGPVTVCSAGLRVLGNFTVESAVSVNSCTSWTVTVDGSFSTVSGSSFTPYGITLNNPSGTAGVAGAFSPAVTNFSAPSATVRAGLAYQAITLTQSTTFSDSVRATGGVTVSGAGTVLDIASPRAVRLGGLLVNGNAALRMQDATDSVVVSGALDVNNAAPLETQLTAGVITVTGDVSGQNYGSSGTHRLILNGSAPGQQYLYNFDQNARPSNIVQSLELANTGGGVNVCSPFVRVRGTLRVSGSGAVVHCTSWTVRVDGDIQTLVGTTVNTYAMSLGNVTGTSNVQGTWTPAFTDVVVPNATLQGGLGYQTVRFQASSNAFTGNFTATGDIIANNAGTVVTFGGRRVTVTGALRSQTSAGCVIATGDTLTVGGDLDIATAGTVATGGQVTVRGNSQLFGLSASGTFKLVFAGVGPSIQQVYTNAALRTIPRIENRNVTTAVQLGDCCGSNGMVATDSLALPLAGASLTSLYNAAWQANGVFRTSSGTTVTGPVHLGGTATLADVLGTFTPSVLRLYGTGTGPGTVLRNAANIAPVSVEFWTSYELSAPLAVAGSVSANGAGTVVTLNGQKITTGTFVDLNSGAVLNMRQAADSVDAGTLVALDGGPGGTYRSGTIIVRGRFDGANYVTDDTGSARLVFAGTGAVQTIAASGRYRRVRVAGTAGIALDCCSTLIVTDSFTVASAVPVSGAASGFDISGPFTVTSASATISAMTLNLRHPSGTSNVATGVNMATSLVRLYGPTTQIRAGLAYGSIELFAATTLTGNVQAAGYVGVYTGGNLTLGGNKVTTGGTFDLTGGVANMTVAADTIDGGGDVYLDGGIGGSYVNGTVIVRGNNFNGTDYQTSDAGRSRLVFLASTGAGPQNFFGPARARDVIIGGTRGVVLQCCAQLVVTDTLALTTPVGLTGPSTGFGFTVLGPLRMVAGASASNVRLTLQHQAGTSNVASGANLTGSLVRLGGPVVNPSASPDTISLRPGIPYGDIEVLSRVTLGGAVSAANMTVGGGTSPRLILGGNTLTLSGNFLVSNGALTMTQPNDTVSTGGYVWLQNATDSINTSLTDGVFRVSGNVAFDAPGVRPSGSHRVFLTRNDAVLQDIFLNSGQGSLRHLEIAGNGSRTVRFNNNSALTRVTGDLLVSSPAAAIILNAGFETIQIGGTFTTTTSTNVQYGNATVRLDGSSGLSAVAGTTAIGTLQIGGTALGQVVPTASRFTYGNLTVLAGATASIGPSPTTLRIGSAGVGITQVAGTLTVPSGVTLTSCNRLDNVAGGTLNLSGATVNSRNAGTITGAYFPSNTINVGVFAGC
jgi:hypothetical protein